MIDEYRKKYCEQMNRVTLSDEADQAILEDILKAGTRKRASYVRGAKRTISAAMVAAALVMASSITVFAGILIHKIIIESKKEESYLEGIGTVDVGESYYYDLLAGDSGELYVLTDNDYKGSLTEHQVIAWKSTDKGDTWEEVLCLPDELEGELDLFAGDLREGEAGLEALVLVEEKNNEAEDGYVNRVYQITADSYKEYDMDEVYARLGYPDALWNMNYVNDHMIALIGTEDCLLYDTNTEKVVKSLPYNAGREGWLKTREQFLLYGDGIYSCIDAETLKEQEPEEGLQEFVRMMYEKNTDGVQPPMAVWNDTVVCVTRAGIYEYQDGEITQIRRLSTAVTKGYAFNGLLPVCKTQDGEYYVCTFGDAGMDLWHIHGEKEEMK